MQMLRVVYPERTNCRPFAPLRVAANGLSMTAHFFTPSTAWVSRSRLSVFRKPRRGAISNVGRAAKTSCSHPATLSRPFSASRMGGPGDRPSRESDTVKLQCQVLAYCSIGPFVNMTVSSTVTIPAPTLRAENIETNPRFYCKEKA